MGTLLKRATGTIDAIATADQVQELTVTMDSYTLDDEVGRIVYITGDNTSQGRYREIVSFNATSRKITLDAPFAESTDTENVGPFRSLVSGSDTDGFSAVNERPIAVGDTFSISKTLAEASTDTDSDITDNSSGQISAYSIIGTGTNLVTIPDTVVIYDKDVILEFNYTSSVRISPGGALILGKQNLGDTSDTNVLGYTSNSCRLIDISAGPFGSDEGRGAFHINGGTYEGTQASGNGTFLRFYGDETVGSVAQKGQSLRFWNVTTIGRVGSRVSGDYSVLLGNTSAANPSPLGFSNALALCLNQDNSIKGSNQAFYISTAIGGSTNIGATEIQDITSQIFRIDSNTGGTTQNIIDWDLGAVDDILQGGTIINSGATNTSTMNWEKNYKLDLTNTDGSAITTGNAKVRFHDTTGTVTSAGTIDSVLGDVPVQKLLAYDHTLGANRANFQAAGVTQSSPYTWAALHRNSNLVTGVTDLLGPVGRIEQSLPIITDVNITNTTITGDSGVDSYTELETAEKLYDYQYKYKEDNMELPTLTTVGFSKSGDVLTVSPADADLSFNNTILTPLSYTDASGWIVKPSATGYTGGIVTTGDVFFDHTVYGRTSATNIGFSGTVPATIINTSEKVDGTIALADGTYTIDGGADVSELSIDLADGATAVVIAIADAVTTVGDNSLTLETGVTTTKSVRVTLQLNEDYDSSKLKKFRWTGATSASDYTSSGKKDHNDSDVSSTTDNDANTVTFSFSLSNDDNLYLFIAYEGYEHAALQGDDIEAVTVTPVALTSSQIDFDEVAVADSDDETLDALSPTVGKTAAGAAFTSTSDDIFIVVPTTAALSTITSNFDKKFVWKAMHTNNWADGVLAGNIQHNAFKFLPSSIQLDFVSLDTEEARYLGNFVKSSNANIVQFASRIINASEADLRTTISSTSSSTEVRFGINASGASFVEVQNAVDVSLDGRLLTDENVIRLGKLQTVITE